MKRLAAHESGSALIAGIIVLMVVLMLGSVAVQYANVQTHQTGNERGGEAAFNVAESALDAEGTLLAQSWPTTAATAWPVCRQSSTTSSTCPESAIAEGFNRTYAGSVYKSPTWSVQLVDDNVSGVADANYYADSILSNAGLAHYDSNGDNKFWIRASATIAGQTRTVVSQISRQSYVVDLPQNVITSGGVITNNNGNKIIIEAKDSTSGLSGTVAVRCNPAGNPPTPTYRDPCAGWDPKHGQLDPASNYTLGYTDPTASYQTLSTSEIDALRQSAEFGGTYYSAGTCPTFGTAGVLFVENADCSYTSNAQWGSDTNPVAIIVAQGTLTINASKIYGIIYMANGQGTAPTNGVCASTSPPQNTVVTIGGSGAIHGGLFIDRCGTAAVGDKGGDNGFDIAYDTAVFNGFRTYASPSLALSTFRVIGNNGS
jgi:Tfp pilus assembly protein PilX